MRSFAAYESVAIDIYGVETEREGPKARARRVVEFSGEARGLAIPFLPSFGVRFRF